MDYQREIKYLEYYVQGERSSNVGFLKRELRNHKCSIEVRITGLRTTDHFKPKVYLNDAEIGTIDVCEGKGCLQFEDTPENNIKGTGISYEQMKILHIPISADKEIWCVIRDGREQLVEQLIGQPQEQSREWRVGQPQEQSRVRQIGQSQEQFQERLIERSGRMSTANQIEKAEQQDGSLGLNDEKRIPIQEDCCAEEEVIVAEDACAEEKAISSKGACNIQHIESSKRNLQQPEISELDVQEERATEVQEERATEVQEERATATQEERGPEVRAESMAETLQKRKVTTKDSKWAQLWEIYPHIHPFQDEREYLSVGPNDFVILSEKYYRLIHNSFLLHGFYNYHHLTLQKRNRNQGNRYYIGVPGNFFEREKQVAVMFGFESFECKEEPAEDGDFGYYMIPVEL